MGTDQTREGDTTESDTTQGETTEVDNTDAELPTVKAWEEEHASEDTEGSAGTADPTKKFREMEVSEEEKKEIEEERERRLDPDNRPENAEVDNTGDNMPDIAKGDSTDDSGD